MSEEETRPGARESRDSKKQSEPSSSNNSAAVSTSANVEGISTTTTTTISSFRDRIRSRLSSSGGRIKSLLQWRNGRWLRDSKGSPITRTSSREEVSVSDDCAVIVEAAGNNPSDETNASRIESQENKSSVPSHNRIDSNLVSSSFDPTMSSYFTDDSMPSLNTDDNANEESETTPRNFSEASNLMTESSDSSNFTLENSDEINPISAAGSLLLPSAVIGIQIQSANPDGQMFDFVPILYVENSPSNTRRTNDTEETFAAHSGSEDSSSNENDSTESNSTGTLFEIVAMMEENGRRFENDFARTYYDANARKRVRKQLRRIEDDPPIY